MDLPVFRRLLAPEGQVVLAAASEMQPTVATSLTCQQRLRKTFPADLVKAALDTILLRAKAKDKFSRADRMYFTREALEQSSGEIISSYRAQRYATFGRVGDFCCGIGGDTIGLAQTAQVTAIDADPVRLAMAEENLRAYDSSPRGSFLLGDLLKLPLPEMQAAFFDPDRRADGKRHVRIREYQPALAAVQTRLANGVPLGVKVAPGAPWDELHTIDAEKEFISVAGELKECVLWFGMLQTAGRRATVLPAGATLSADRPDEAALPVMPLAFLYDPDPALVRAGLIANLGRQLDARPIDSEIAYLTATRATGTPFAQCFAVEAALPFHTRRIGAYLRQHNVGSVTITKRGSAVDVDAMRRMWKLKGTETRTVFLTRVLGKPWALIAQPARCTA